MSISPISGMSPPTSSDARESSGAAKVAAETQAANNAAAAQAAEAQAIVAEQYSMRAAGKTWSASIEPANGGYAGSVLNLPGASAYGDTVARVESSLGNLISFFA